MLRLSQSFAPAPPSDQRERPIESTRGAALVSILLALLIAAALYFGYFKMQNTMSGGRSAGIAAIDSSRAVVCRTQRQQIERDIMMWSVNHPDEPPTLAALQHDGLHIPDCPEGGRYSIDGREVHCSLHR